MASVVYMEKKWDSSGFFFNFCNSFKFKLNLNHLFLLESILDENENLSIFFILNTWF